MKKIFLPILAFFLSIAAMAQGKDPVTWTFTAVKKSAGVYEVTATATLPKPWHIYSQNTGKGGPVPTSFTFKANPLVSKQGTVTEKGKLEKTYDENFKTDVLYYGDKVSFTQVFKVKGTAKTNVSGTVEYMVCNDEMCLPPTKKAFDVKLQ